MSDIRFYEPRGYVDKEIKKVSYNDLKKVIDNQKNIEKKINKNNVFLEFVNDIKVMLLLINDYFAGKYKKTPWWVISAVVFALLYVFNPMDMMPDFVPFIGLIDDLTVLGLCITMIRNDLAKYRAWKDGLN